MRINARLSCVPGRLALLLGAVLALGLFSVAAKAADEADIARGGRLFDNWIAELKERPPLAPNPRYKAPKDLNQINEAGWRCVSCHGWDYQGLKDQATGPLAKAGLEDPARLASVLRDPRHQYENRLSERDIADLFAFLQNGMIDMSEHIDPEGKRPLGDKSREAVLFATICANCHGMDGQRIASMAPLGTLVRANPQEALHKILNGHPAEKMPALRFLPISRIWDLLAYAHALPDRDQAASIARGGRLYDNWQKETGARPKTYRHPAYPRIAAFAAMPKMNWRCKECHGWDYKGSAGIYGSGTHRTGIKGVRAMAGGRPADILAILTDANHRFHGTNWFRSPLSYRDLIDLANFISRGQIDMDLYIDRKTGHALGNPQRRRMEFNVLCATCHGRNGKALPTGKDIGDVARSNPWEALHKIRNGHPDEAMPALHALDSQMLVDILAYAQTLPE